MTITALASRRMKEFGGSLARDERGAVLIYVSIALTVFMGFAALVIDGGRLFTLNTELQSAADALALAGAAELDGNADAEDRADLAMANMVQNDQTFATGAAAITAYSVRYLSALADDDQPLSDATVSTDPAESRFVEVTVSERAIDTIFAPMIGGDGTAGSQAVAIAGFTSAVCKFTPLFMCNPFEADDPSLENFIEEFDTPAERRRVIAMKKSGSGASYTPGNFGFLESELGPGAKTLAESLASTDPATCFRKDGVETKTGSTNSVHHAINVRFDLYDAYTNSWKNNADYRPAKNVTKGYLATGGGCNMALDTATPPTAMGFPIDSAINPDTRMGNGDWGGNFETYWNINHPGVPPPPGWNNANPPTRYEAYRWEIDSTAIPNNSPSGENGNPTCNTNGVSDIIDRRIIYAAVINCIEQDLRGGSGDTVPALTFLKMFITQPMTKLPGTGLTDEDDTLYAEMVDIVEPGIDDEVVHDIVQLYR